MTRPVVTAAARRAVHFKTLENGPIHGCTDEEPCSECERVATALTTARAEPTRDEEDWIEEIHGLRTQRDTLQARVTALETALHMLINATEALAHSANLSLADDALDAARRALTPDTMDPTVTRLRIRGRLINRARP
jgi:hypothetical protein